MSSPVVNKDTVFIYKSGLSFHPCFIDDWQSAYTEGRSLDISYYHYWNWTGRTPKDIAPIGQRCILQW